MEASEQIAPAESEALAQTPDVITPAEPVQETKAEPDLAQIGEQIGNLQERFDSQFPSEQQGNDASLSSLFGESDQQQQPETDEFGGADNFFNTDEGIDWLGQEQGPPQFNSQQELDKYVTDKAAEVLQPYAFQQEMNARQRQLGELEQKYPDISKHVEEIRSELSERAEQYGIDPRLLATDPKLVESVYKALKADEASSAEVPAEHSANAGASLETATGPGSTGQEIDPGEAFAQRFTEMAQGTQRDAFS